MTDGCFSIVRKLDQLDSVTTLDELRVPPGNRLESLTGDRHGQYSIRINERYSICFVWTDAGAEQVEIVDYHAGLSPVLVMTTAGDCSNSTLRET